MHIYKGREKEYRRIQSKERREQNPIKYLLRQAKYRAKKKGIEFSLKYEDLIIPEFCPVFGFRLGFSKGRRQAFSYSIDRLDNSKGYTKENTRVISWKANQYKGNLTIEDVEALLKYMKEE